MADEIHHIDGARRDNSIVFVYLLVDGILNSVETAKRVRPLLHGELKVVRIRPLQLFGLVFVWRVINNTVFGMESKHVVQESFRRLRPRLFIR